MNWQPMDTAPKDGTRILVWTHRFCHEMARWNEDKFARSLNRIGKRLGLGELQQCAKLSL